MVSNTEGDSHFGRRNVIGKKQVLVGLVGLFGLVLAAGCGQKAKAKTAVAEVPAVVIKAYYPFNESHQFIADYLKQVEKLNPGNVQVTLYDMQTPEGRKAWSTSGLTCAGVFVNGSTRHEIDRGEGKTETVDFLQRMDVFWAKDDFETVLTQILANDGKTFNAPPREPEKAEGDETGAKASGGAEAGTADTGDSSSN